MKEAMSVKSARLRAQGTHVVPGETKQKPTENMPEIYLRNHQDGSPVRIPLHFGAVGTERNKFGTVGLEELLRGRGGEAPCGFVFDLWYIPGI